MVILICEKKCFLTFKEQRTNSSFKGLTPLLETFSTAALSVYKVIGLEWQQKTELNEGQCILRVLDNWPRCHILTIT